MGGEPPAEDGVDLGRGPLVGRLGGEVDGLAGADELVDLVGREGPAVDPEVVEGGVVDLDELFRWPTLNGTLVRIEPLRLSASTSVGPELAVDVDLDPGGLARAVVGDEDVVPLVRLEGRRRRRP